MTPAALAGLLALNLLYGLTGALLVWALRGYRTWWEALRLAGLAYLLGVACLGVAWTLLLVAGIPFGWGAILGTMILLGGAAVATGIRLGRPVPGVTAPATLTAVSLVAAAGVALTGVLLEALFRAARLQPLSSWDGWAFWVPKGKALFYWGELDAGLLATIPGPSYPPVQPLLEAAAFHASGGPDVVTLHVQFWLVAVGLAAAAAGLLAERVPPWLLWPSLLLALAAPRFTTALLVPQADVLLGTLIAIAALLLARWLQEGEPWLLVAATPLLACATVTKREGLLLAGCVYAAALVAALPERARSWRWLLASAGGVAAAALPWRVWYEGQGLEGELPGLGLPSVGRAIDALRLSFDVLLDESRWSLLPVVAIASVVLALGWGSRRLGVYVGLTLLFVVLGGAWVTVAFTEIPVTAEESLNPVVRYTGTAILAAACLVPLALASAWAGRERGRPS